MSACPRCGGNFYDEDGDWVCLQCGNRKVADPLKRPSTASVDAYDAAVAALADAVATLKPEIAKAEGQVRKRREQIRRLEKAIVILSGSLERPKREFSAESKARMAEGRRRYWAKRREQAAQVS